MNMRIISLIASLIPISILLCAFSFNHADKIHNPTQYLVFVNNNELYLALCPRSKTFGNCVDPNPCTCKFE